MKKLLWIVLIILLLSGCAGLPEPEETGNSLIIGSLELDFPDGFFSLRPGRFNNNIKLTFLNTTKNLSFTIKTSSGYFYFLSNGTDSYVLESYEFVKEKYHDSYTINGNVDYSFTPIPNSLVYIGDSTYTYTEPDKVGKTSRGKVKHTTWTYDVSDKCVYDTAAMLNYIREINPDSSWLSYELFIIESQKK